MAKQAEYCLICARARLRGEYSCPRCGTDTYGDEIPGDGQHWPREPAPPLLGLIGELIELPIGALCLFYGPKGIGKTTVAIGTFPAALFGTTEMGPDLVRDYAARLGATLAGVRVPRVTREPEVSVDLRAGGPVDYVLDSLNGTRAPAAALAACRALCELGGRVIALAQVTQDGDIRGGEDLGHDCDVVIRFDHHAGNHRIVVEKNRFGPTTSRVFRLGPNGADRAPRDRYYSVEGQAPHYRLEPYPSSSAKHAAVLAEQEKRLADGFPSALPAPPAAVAALKSGLYAGGWIEPEDVDARRAFAEAAGVPYWSPVRKPR